MDWITLHGKELAGGILLLVGLVAMLCPKALMPHKRIEQLKKLHLPLDVFPKPKKSASGAEFPLALNLFLRVTGLLFAFAGAVILLAQH